MCPSKKSTRRFGACSKLDPSFSAIVLAECSFWQEIWKAVRLEERLISVEDLPDVEFPAGLNPTHLEEILEDAPS